jgi:hypothetical protein
VGIREKSLESLLLKGSKLFIILEVNNLSLHYSESKEENEESPGYFAYAITDKRIIAGQKKFLGNQVIVIRRENV